MAHKIRRTKVCVLLSCALPIKKGWREVENRFPLLRTGPIDYQKSSLRNIWSISVKMRSNDGYNTYMYILILTKFWKTTQNLPRSAKTMWPQVRLSPWLLTQSPFCQRKSVKNMIVLRKTMSSLFKMQSKAAWRVG